LDAGVHPFELRFLLKSWKCSEKLSRASIDDLIDHYTLREGSVIYPVDDGQLVVDHGRVFHLKTPLTPQNWKIEKSTCLSPLLGWESVFQGRACFLVPNRPVEIGEIDQVLDKKAKESYLKHLSSASVPHFLRKSVPVAIDESGKVYSPFFAGKENLPSDGASSISLLYA
jgi:hypothetical protein